MARTAVPTLARRAQLTALLLALAALSLAAPARAAVLTVTNTKGKGPGSLRRAIAAANADGDKDTVRFIAGLRGTIVLKSGDLTITRDLVLHGPGARKIAVSGNHASRVFAVGPKATVTISGLTVRDGAVRGTDGETVTAAAGAAGPGESPGLDGDDGESVTVMGSPGQTGEGAGIHNRGTLTLRRVVVRGNVARAGAGGDANATGGKGGMGGTGGSAGSGGADGGAGGNGGDALADGGAGGAAMGGGVFNAGTLTIDRSTIARNRAVGADGGDANSHGGAGGAGGTGGADPGGGNGGNGGNGGDGNTVAGAGGDGRGGGVFSLGTLKIRNSTISSNSARAGAAPGDSEGSGGADGAGGSPGAGGGGPGGFKGFGGGGFRHPGIPGPGDGGGIWTGHATRLTSLTIANNSSPRGANVLENLANPVVRNTIVAHPRGGGASWEGSSSSKGFNLDSGTSCGFGRPTDRSGVNPKLGPLRDNGGPTPTRAIAKTSPAVDRGTSARLRTDQRGVARKVDQPGIPNAAQGDASDIGAFEIADTTRPAVSKTSADPRHPKPARRSPSATR